MYLFGACDPPLPTRLKDMLIPWMSDNNTQESTEDEVSAHTSPTEDPTASTNTVHPTPDQTAPAHTSQNTPDPEAPANTAPSTLLTAYTKVHIANPHP